jgi:hypothetical protein
MLKPLTQSDLKGIRCGNPACEDNHPILFMTPGCHQKGAVEATYDKSTGVLTIRCYECEKEVGRFLLAAGAN